MDFRRSGSGKSGFVIGKVRSADGVFGNVKAPGLGSVKVMDRKTFDKASKAAGSSLRNMASGKGSKDASPTKR